MVLTVAVGRDVRINMEEVRSKEIFRKAVNNY